MRWSRHDLLRDGPRPDESACDREEAWLGVLNGIDGFPGHWRAYPGSWAALPDEALLGRETLSVVMSAIEELPAAQRVVITMRDVAGCSSGSPTSS